MITSLVPPPPPPPLSPLSQWSRCDSSHLLSLHFLHEVSTLPSPSPPLPLPTLFTLCSTPSGTSQESSFGWASYWHYSSYWQVLCPLVTNTGSYFISPLSPPLPSTPVSGFAFFQFYCFESGNAVIPGFITNSSLTNINQVQTFLNRTQQIAALGCEFTSPLRDFFSANAPWYRYQKETWLAVGGLSLPLSTTHSH